MSQAEVPPHSPNAPDGSSPSTDDPRLNRAMEEYLAAVQAGRPPDREALLAEHADIAAALAECLDGLEFIHGAAPHLQESDADRGALAMAAFEGLHPEALLGDFRIVREIGRGGRGVVYEAVQVSLGRHVALKVLPAAAALDARQAQRFKNEAQAAAGLHHGHIVPVFGVGCEGGVHYYAMQFIDGKTLARIISDLRIQSGLLPAEPPTSTAEEDMPAAAVDSQRTTDYPSPARKVRVTTAAGTGTVASPPTRAPKGICWGRAYCRRVADLGAAAAEALEHAHQMGVVHRDVKPANLMLDGSGHLWVTDFGLAHVQSQSGLTMTGEMVGTLRYMSPEQVLGRRGLVDHRTDIYALGVTLRAADAGAGLPRQRPPGPLASDHGGGTAPAAAAQPGHPAGSGNRRPEGDGQGTGRALRHGPGVGRRPTPLPGGPADPGAAAVAAAAGVEVGAAAPDVDAYGGGVRGAVPGAGRGRPGGR
jgi:hypothetical protein